MGLHDLPALVDYMLGATGARSVHVIGHSMATSAALVFLAERPEYNAKVRLTSLMSPSIRMRRGPTLYALNFTFGRPSLRSGVQVGP